MPATCNFCTNVHVRLVVGVSTRRTSRVGWAWWNDSAAMCDLNKNQLTRYFLADQGIKFEIALGFRLLSRSSPIWMAGDTTERREPEFCWVQSISVQFVDLMNFQFCGSWSHEWIDVCMLSCTLQSWPTCRNAHKILEGVKIRTTFAKWGNSDENC
jgi:hypothetical protein